MLEIAGVAISLTGLAVDLAGRIKGWTRWEEGEDLLVDNVWLATAKVLGVLVAAMLAWGLATTTALADGR